MIRRYRPMLRLLLSLLLVGMQLQAQAHALEHVGEMLRHSPEHSLVAPALEACATCALFAGGSNAIASGAADVDLAADGGDTLPRAFVSFAPAIPSYYLSRAPPSLL